MMRTTLRELAVPRDLSAERVDRDLRDEIETTNAHGSSDDRPGVRDHVFGHPDERAIGAHLPTASLRRRHALDLLHPAPGTPRAVPGQPHDRCGGGYAQGSRVSRSQPIHRTRHARPLGAQSPPHHARSALEFP